MIVLVVGVEGVGLGVEDLVLNKGPVTYVEGFILDSQTMMFDQTVFTLPVEDPYSLVDVNKPGEVRGKGIHRVIYLSGVFPREEGFVHLGDINY